MRLSVVVITYNWPQALDLVLRALARQTVLPDEVIVTDDGSREDTAVLLRGLARDYPTRLVHLWQPDDGARMSRARNRAIAAAQGDYIILLDGDMLVHPQFIADHLMLAERGYFLQGGRLKATQQESRRLLEGGKPVFAPWVKANFDEFDGTRRLYAFRAPLLARWKAHSRNGGRVMSCNMSFWREDLLRVNGFDERMEGYGAEDRELAARLENAGIRRRALKWCALAVHLWHDSRSPPDVDDMSLPNNRLFFATRNEGIQRCERGIDQHVDLLAASDRAP